jgi:hypothetical protein
MRDCLLPFVVASLSMVGWKLESRTSDVTDCRPHSDEEWETKDATTCSSSHYLPALVLHKIEGDHVTARR